MRGPDRDGPRRGVSGIRLLLAGSLAFNLLLLGVIGGAVIRHGGWHADAVPRLHRGGGPLTRALSDADRAAIRRDMRAAYDGRALQAAYRTRIEALIAALEAPDFDRAAVAAHLERHRAAFGERLDQGQRLLLQRMERMDGAARAAYAARLRQEMQQRDRAGHGHRRAGGAAD